MHQSLAVPRRGHVLTTVSEKYGRPIRTAVAILTRDFAQKNCVTSYRLWMSRRIAEPNGQCVRPHAELLAWNLVSIWLTGFSTRRIKSGTSLHEAANWFFDSIDEHNPTNLLSRQSLAQADDALAACSQPTSYLELLPYVLDPHGPGSRLSIRRDNNTRTARIQKRAQGVYYTPADVATYMVNQCFKGLGHEQPSMIFDPACGTGVFLRTALKALRERSPHQTVQSLATSAIFGTDIDAWALDASAFVLLADCLAHTNESKTSPLLLWHRLRLNLARVDALKLGPRSREMRQVSEGERGVVDALASGRLPILQDKPAADAHDKTISISKLFLAPPNGRLVIVGNPPYTTLGERRDVSFLKTRFASLRQTVTRTSQIYPIFLEQMVRLASGPPAAGTMVLPLSLASNVGNQFVQTRMLIENTPGRWRFAFFDREPHALFGEDVKTRNTILFWQRDDDENSCVVESGPLRKWRGDGRATMFSSIRFTRVLGGIRGGIPKFEGVSQANAYETLATRWHRLDHVCASIRRMPLKQALSHDECTIFIGATAYNFLNVFLKPKPICVSSTSLLSEHPLHAMEFATTEDTLAAFALLASDLTYWWWHANHDGFHVSKRFLASLPFGIDALSGKYREELAEHGKQLWSRMCTNPIISSNRGRISLAYSPNSFANRRRNIDLALVKLAGLEEDFVSELQGFTELTIKAGSCVILDT